MKRLALSVALALAMLPASARAQGPVVTILAPTTGNVFRWPEDRFLVVANVTSAAPLDWVTVQFVHPQTGALLGGTWSATGSMLNCRPEACLIQTSPTTWRFQRYYDSVSLAAGLVGVQVLAQSNGTITRSAITGVLLSLTMPTICIPIIR